MWHKTRSIENENDIMAESNRKNKTHGQCNLSRIDRFIRS